MLLLGDKLLFHTMVEKNQKICETTVVNKKVLILGLQYYLFWLLELRRHIVMGFSAGSRLAEGLIGKYVGIYRWHAHTLVLVVSICRAIAPISECSAPFPGLIFVEVWFGLLLALMVYSRYLYERQLCLGCSGFVYYNEQ